MYQKGNVPKEKYILKEISKKRNTLKEKHIRKYIKKEIPKTGMYKKGNVLRMKRY